MGVSKVVFGSQTVVDLTSDTVNAENLLSGTTAHNAAGNQVVGTVTLPEYTIVKDATAAQDASATYHLTKDGVNTGEPINIPKDMVVQSGTVETCTTANEPVQGLAVGDKYIDLVIANSDNSHVYVKLSDLVSNAASGISYYNVTSGLDATDVQAAIDELSDEKVDKVTGKGLSTEDYTSEEKQKLAGITPGGSSPYTYMTQAEYEALEAPDPDTLYWVTYPLSGDHIVWRGGIAIDRKICNITPGTELPYDYFALSSFGTFAPTSDSTSPLRNAKCVDIARGVGIIPRGAFYSANKLTSVSIPNSVTNIGEKAFNNCIELTSVTIPDGVQSIGQKTFALCEHLEAIVIPVSVTDIGQYAFSNCALLSSFSFAGTKAQWNSVYLGYAWKNNTPFTAVHCSDGDSTRL